ncbi:uncharacterized protein F5147DRAFT_654894 [Suillus discolor]|uniref:Uncharacterized protein n=1 Tax=Suillus discolor TaxID=1912936 RepID=A0A9P7F3E4_9AGAM|nr:uncharacterized protein F5147DRAFT_654894 [Suillus discolor]KAG2102807.1 hypothetical protein F5147DRAFT_654894 [Suillus discolor]
MVGLAIASESDITPMGLKCSPPESVQCSTDLKGYNNENDYGFFRVPAKIAVRWFMMAQHGGPSSVETEVQVGPEPFLADNWVKLMAATKYTDRGEPFKPHRRKEYQSFWVANRTHRGVSFRGFSLRLLAADGKDIAVVTGDFRYGDKSSSLIEVHPALPTPWFEENYTTGHELASAGIMIHDWQNSRVLPAGLAKLVPPVPRRHSHKTWQN